MSRAVRAEADLPAPPPGLGRGWAGLVAELNHRLAQVEPPARAVPSLDPAGGLSLVLYDPADRPATRALCAAVEREAWSRCEACGGAGQIRAGLVLRVLCDRCAAGR